MSHPHGVARSNQRSLQASARAQLRKRSRPQALKVGVCVDACREQQRKGSGMSFLCPSSSARDHIGAPPNASKRSNLRISERSTGEIALSINARRCWQNATRVSAHGHTHSYHSVPKVRVPFGGTVNKGSFACLRPSRGGTPTPLRDRHWA